MRGLAGLLWVVGCAASTPMANATAPAPPSPTAARTNPDAQPHELGRVAWIRDLEAGRAEARSTGKPILLLFTEVPGCNTVNRFADNALEHPVFVRAAQELFVPVVVYNNTSGDRDARVRVAFGEPSWNNPVVRIIDADDRALAPRYASKWTAGSYGSVLVSGLRGAGRPVPTYLADHVDPLNAGRDGSHRRQPTASTPNR